MSRDLVRFVVRDPDATTLIITNMWPDADWPVYGVFVRRQVDALRSAGLRCDVLYVKGRMSRAAYLAAALRLSYWNMHPPAKYYLAHVHAGETALVARAYLRAPMLATFHGDDIMGDREADGSARFSNRVKCGVIRLVSHLFQGIVVQSDEMYMALPRTVRSRSEIIPCGVDPNVFDITERDSARALLGYSDTQYLVLFAAIKPDSPNKRRKLAEAAVAHASRALGKIEMLMAINVAPEEMPLYMNAADCLLHTAVFEGSPNVVREALMCNLPVVATPSGDLAQLLDGVEPSRLCRADPIELGDALVEVLSQERRSNGRAARHAQLSSTAVSARLITLYKDISRRWDRRRARWISP